MAQFLERFFKLKENKTTIRTEIVAGLTTFMTMAYILVVNPATLADAGMSFGKVFTATVLSAVVGTLIMALVARLPFALAAGMGLNAFFAYYVVLGLGKSYQFALTAVFLEGLIFILLSLFNIREAIIKTIPANIKKAVSVGIGLFIAFIGLVNAGIILDHPATLVSLNPKVFEGASLLAVIGLALTGILLAFKVRGALFISILATTLIGIPMGITQLPSQLISVPEAPYFFDFEWAQIFTWDMLIILITFLFVDIFDTVGTLVGVATKAEMLTPTGEVPRAKQALFADAVATTVGAALGTSTVTTYVESAAGVAEGGRTGLTSVSTAFFFLIALMFAPVFTIVPAAATAPALILVGLFMLSPVKEIDFADYSEALPAFLTIIMMPLTYSIADGIIFGVLSYVVLKVMTLRAKEVPPVTYVLAILFAAKLYFG